MYLKTCWSPCFWHSNVRHGSYAVAVYTALMSFCLLVYTAYVMNGGDSSQFYLPFFESDLETSTQHAGRFALIFFLTMMAFSVMLVFGIRTDIRGLMIPWMAGMCVVFFFQVGYQFSI